MSRRTAESQERVLALMGAAVLLVVILAVLFIMVNPFGGRSPNQMSVVIETPYVGQGVEAGTAVVLHGARVGEVTNVSLSPDGDGARLVTDLERRPVTGLTDKMAIDFRPINYFGVPGVNITPRPGGQPLRDGSELSLVPAGNFTFTELLSQLGDVTAAAVTPQLIEVVDRVTRYTDGLNPLFETMVLATNTVVDGITVPTAQLLANTAPISAALPPFADSLLDLSSRQLDYDYPDGSSGAAQTGQRLAPPYLTGVKLPNYQDETHEFFYGNTVPSIKLAADELFAAVGRLESSHVDDLLPLIGGVKALTDTTPSLLRPDDIARTMAEVRTRWESMFAGNGEQRALQVRILLDSLPGVAAPLGVIGPPGVAAAPGAEASLPSVAAAPGTEASLPGAEPAPAEVQGG
jgi:hypothetical protein